MGILKLWEVRDNGREAGASRDTTGGSRHQETLGGLPEDLLDGINNGHDEVMGLGGIQLPEAANQSVGE